LLGTNIAEILIVFLAMMIFQVSPFISIQLLWINLVTDSLPAIALGMERVNDDCMNRRPRKKTEGLFSHGYGIDIILHGVVIGALVLACYIIGYKVCDSQIIGSTMAFISLAFCEIIQSYNMRSEHSLFKHNPFENKTLNWACLISLALVVAVVCIPGVNGAFNTAFMPWWCYLVVLASGILVIVYMEIFKIIKNKIQK
jgi:Ca2+-transporting ATPase